MKIRNSFVSNSSSASFIVTVEKNKQDLVVLLTENISGLNFFKFKDELEKSKKSKEDRLAALKEPLILGIDFKSCYEDSVKEIQKKIDDLIVLENKGLENWTFEDKFELYKTILDYYHISFKPLFNNSDNIWRFSYYTSMFNDYGDLTPLLQEIIVALSFDNCNIKCEVVDGY